MQKAFYACNDFIAYQYLLFTIHITSLQFYVYPKNELRLQLKEDVLLYCTKAKITKFDTSGECDTGSQDNV